LRRRKLYDAAFETVNIIAAHANVRRPPLRKRRGGWGERCWFGCPHPQPLPACGEGSPEYTFYKIVSSRSRISTLVT
jgi:hypothetical protein